MTVYADILVLINTYVNFFVLLSSSALLRLRVPIWKMIIGALMGGFSALIILLPKQNELISCVIHLILALIIVLVSFGLSNWRMVLKRLAIFFATSFIFSGCVYCFWLAFKPDRLIINNSVIYFDISAIELIIVSAVIYAIFMIVRLVCGGFNKNQRQTVKLELIHNGRELTYTCLIDTGNMLRDCFTDMPIAVVDNSISRSLEIDFYAADEAAIRRNKIRFIPFDTVGNSGLMPIFKPDKVKVDGKVKNDVLIGVSARRFDGEHNAVANYDII